MGQCCEQPYRIWALVFFFFFYVPQSYLWGSPFLDGIIEVVTLRLRGWCMLGVFLLPAFIRLGHECNDVLSPCDGMHVSTDSTSVYTLIRKSFGGVESEQAHIASKGKKSPLRKKKSPQSSIKPTTLHQAGQRANHTTNELFRLPGLGLIRLGC